LTAKQIVEKWVSAFNAADTATLESLYATDAINHQMPSHPVQGRPAIGEMFRREFAASPQMYCLPRQIIAEGDWAVLEWTDPKGFSGCGFFQITNGLIRVQRGYWDRLTFNKLYNIADR
jgi:hypothetical protein